MSAGTGRRPPVAVGVVVPVHDEEDLLPTALEGIDEAVDALPTPTSCRVAVVLDDCRDGSSAVARAWASRVGALVIERECRGVGSARRAGTEALLSLWPDVQPARIWIATTDADSRVPPDWLTVQLEAYGSGSDLWAGRVGVTEESAAVEHWKERYAAERQPIHGASMGFSALVSEQIAGFRPLRTGEDRDFHRRAVAAGFQVTYDLRAAVTTSARRKGRAPGGFAGVLVGVEEEQFEASA